MRGCLIWMMSQAFSNSADLTGTGLEVLALSSVPGFPQRRVSRLDPATQMEGLQRLARAFVDSPETLLQELVNAAVELCGAESAGISVQTTNGEGNHVYHWVATAGEYGRFLNAMLRSLPSACSVCIERGEPQLFRVTQEFFDLMGIVAAPVTDGILIPWREGDTNGTVWIMAHGRTEAFDQETVRLMEVLADFAAMAMRQKRQQALLVRQAGATAATSMANDLAHRINNPLQSLTNMVYMAAEGPPSEDSRKLAQLMQLELQRLSALVSRLLALPFAKSDQ